MSVLRKYREVSFTFAYSTSSLHSQYVVEINELYHTLIFTRFTCHQIRMKNLTSHERMTLLWLDQTWKFTLWAVNRTKFYTQVDFSYTTRAFPKCTRYVRALDRNFYHLQSCDAFTGPIADCKSGCGCRIQPMCNSDLWRNVYGIDRNYNRW